MNNKGFIFLKGIIDNDKAHTISELSYFYHVSERSIRNYIYQCQNYLTSLGMNDVLEYKNNIVRIILDDKQKEYISKHLIELDFYDYALSQEERFLLISIILITSLESVRISDLERILSYSKTSIVNDLKKVIKYFEQYGITINESKHNGYSICGEENVIRNVLYKLIKNYENRSKKLFDKNYDSICTLYIANRLNVDTYLVKIENEVSFIEQKYNIVLADNDYYDSLLHTIILLNRYNDKKYVEPTSFTPDNIHTLASEILKKLIPYPTDKDNLKYEINYLAQLLSKKNIIINNIHEINEGINFFVIVKTFLNRLSKNLNYNFDYDKKLQDFLTAHIIAMYNRINSNEKIINTFKNSIIENYNKEFQYTKKEISYLENNLGITINNDEITYILMHIMASIERQKKNIPAPRVLVLCNSGFGTSQFLSENLKQLFNIDIIDITSLHNIQSKNINFLKNLKKKCDFIVSTIPIIDLGIPYVVVDAILTPEDLEKIRKMIVDYSNSYNELTRSEAGNIINNFNNTNTSIVDSSNLYDLITLDKIQINKKCKDWKDALIVASEPLLFHVDITPDYQQAIISNVMENGSYFVFTPGVAFAHANYPKGVNRTAASFTRLKNKIYFGSKENDPVKYIIVFSMVDKKVDKNLVFNIMNMMCSSKTIKKFDKAKNEEEILEIIRNYKKED